jgi:hypothetical protein
MKRRAKDLKQMGLNTREFTTQAVQVTTNDNINIP